MYDCEGKQGSEECMARCEQMNDQSSFHASWAARQLQLLWIKQARPDIRLARILISSSFPGSAWI